jgi:hypothetical protein
MESEIQMKHLIPDIVVCRQEPVVAKISDERYLVVYRRDIDLTMAFADEVHRTNQLLLSGLKAVEKEPSHEDESAGQQSTVVGKPEIRKACRWPEFPKKKPIGVPKWKIRDRESRVLEYYGRPVRFSKIQFGILEALILAEGKALTYGEISQAAWGESTDPATVEATIYQLNVNLKHNGIDQFVSCRKGRILLTDGPPEKRPPKGPPQELP